MTLVSNMSWCDKGRMDPPNAVQIELVEGCNLHCAFCGLRGIREKAGGPYKYMEVDLAEHLARILCVSIENDGWNPRIEFAMHGEPTLHPQFYDVIASFRAHLPDQQIMLTTNGQGFLKDTEKVVDLLRMLVDVVAIDDYTAYKIGQKVRDRFDELGIRYHDYPADPSKSPHTRRRKDQPMEIVFIEDIAKADKGTHSSLNNHAGAAAPLNHHMAGKRCAKPFRELAVRWDGAVAVCCNDWRGTLPMGRIQDHLHINDLWQNDRFRSIRRYLYHGKRSIGPCFGCDAKSYRTGLLPDRMGLDALPQPTESDKMLLEIAMKEGPLTEPVKRAWEA